MYILHNNCCPMLEVENESESCHGNCTPMHTGRLHLRTKITRGGVHSKLEKAEVKDKVVNPVDKEREEKRQRFFQEQERRLVRRQKQMRQVQRSP